MKIVKRTLQDFIVLRNELLYETPELFLPTYKEILNPESIDLHPPPLTLVHTSLKKLQSLMNYLLYHPILRNHDLVVSFVRSTADLQQSVMHDHSTMQRKLLLEKMSVCTSIMNTKEEEYFLQYIEDMMKPLKMYFKDIIMAGRKLIHSGTGLC